MRRGRGANTQAVGRIQMARKAKKTRRKAKVSAAPPRSAKKKKLVAPKSTVRWSAFLKDHPTPYSAIFANTRPLPRGTRLKLLRQVLSDRCSGEWETLRLVEGDATVIFVVFAEKSDFDLINKLSKGRPWRSTIKGAIDGFQAEI